MSSAVCIGSYYCVCCISTDDLGPLLCPVASYADILKDIFMVKVFPAEEDCSTSDSYICSECADNLQEAERFKERLMESIRTLRINGLIKTRRGKGGYLYVKPVRNEEIIDLGVVDESLIKLSDKLNNPMELNKQLDNVKEKSMNVEDIKNHNNEIIKIEFSKCDMQETIKYSPSILLETEYDIDHTEIIEEQTKVFKNINKEAKPTEFARNYKSILVNKKEFLYDKSIDDNLSNGSQELGYIVENINNTEKYDSTLQQFEQMVGKKDCKNNILEIGHVKEDTEIEEYSEDSQHIEGSVDVSGYSKLIFQGVEHITEVTGQELQDFPGDFEEIEIDSRDTVQDFNILMDISDDPVVPVERFCSDRLELHENNPQHEPDSIYAVNNYDNIQQNNIKKLITANQKAEVKKKPVISDVNRNRLSKPTLIIYNDNLGKKKQKHIKLYNKFEPNKQIIENVTADSSLGVPIEKEKRIIVTRIRKKKPAGSKSKEPPLYHVNPEFRCEHCSQVLPNLRVFHNHMNVHFPNFTCDACGKAFLSEKRLKRHIPTHAKGPFTCPVCDAQFGNYNTMNSHRQRKHRALMLYKCTECDERFLTFHRRTIHLAEKHGHNEKKYKCQICSKMFMISGNLSAHVRRVHQQARRHAGERRGAGASRRQPAARRACCPRARERRPRGASPAVS